MDLVPNSTHPRFSRKAVERSELWKQDPQSAIAAFEQREELGAVRPDGAVSSQSNRPTIPSEETQTELRMEAAPVESNEIARLVRIVSPLLEEQLPGMYDDPLTLNEGAVWIVHPEGCLGAVLVREHWRPHVAIKGGIALHMPLSYELAYRVANLNRELWFGRLYLRSNPQEGIALVILEDIAFGAAVDETNPRALQDLGWRIGTLMKLAGGFAQDMIAEFGGQPFGPDDSMFLDI